MASIVRIAVARPLFSQCIPRAAAPAGRAVARPHAKNGTIPTITGDSQRRTFAVSRTAQEKKYTKDHEWIELAPDGKTGTIGVSTYAASSLGDVVYVELPETSLEVSAGDSIGAVESVKSASDILTPLSGTIIESNKALEETPGLINRDPEGEQGWIAKLQVGDKGKEEFAGEELMSKEDYTAFTEE